MNWRLRRFSEKTDENESKQALYIYGYRLEHLADIAFCLQQAELTPQDVGRFLEDYSLMYEKAEEAAFKKIEQSLERALKPWRGEEDEL